MQTTRSLVDKAVEEGLLDPDGLFGPDEPLPPPGYDLVRCLGRGGCGVVYLARDERLDRPVAIKFLADAGAADLERFRREARFTARLNNPSIVQVYELGEVEGRPFIAMQYIDGGSLGAAELPARDVARVVRDVAEALRHAHAEGIIHRDIKPENVLLDRDGHVYLTDFGIARNVYGAIEDTISREGQVMGTPGLMPPEQARGEIHAVDARSDVYSLGATLYLKLTGHYPFESTNVVDVLHAVIHQHPPLMRAHNAAIPRSLETIAAKCMHKAREDRYQTVEEVIADLDRFLAGDQVASPSAPWLRRLVTTVAGLEEEATVEDLRADPYWSEGLDIVREIASWDTDLYRVSGSLSRSFARLDSIRTRLDDILAARPDAAWARFYRGVALFRRGRLYEALEDMERTIDRMSNLSGAYFELGRLYIAIYLREQRIAHKHLSETGVHGGLASARDRLDEAVIAFREAKRLGGDVPAWLDECGSAVQRLAERDYAGCVAVCDRILADEPDVEGVWKLRGDAQHFAGLDPFESYDRALDIRRSYFEALYARAQAHLSRDRTAAARRDLQRALKINPEFTDAAALLARTHFAEWQAAGGAGALDAGIDIARHGAALDGHNYDVTITLAEMLIAKGRLEADDRVLQSALDTLGGAEELEGCPNRVNLLIAAARLERARLARAAGRDPGPEIEAVMVYCRSEGANVKDNEPWEAIRREAEAELASQVLSDKGAPPR